MAAQTTLIGNTTSDVELRYTSSSKPVANVTIAVTDRVKDQQTGEWKDGAAWFARCTIWGALGEHAAASLPKGSRVIAFGRIAQRNFEDREGNKRSSVEVTVDALGPELLWATASVTRIGTFATQAAEPAADQWIPAGEGQQNDEPF